VLLKQEFKTFAGACKRAAFENAHSKTHHYAVVRQLYGCTDTGPIDKTRLPDYRWRLERTKR
jgi:hypothetical protein